MGMFFQTVFLMNVLSWAGFAMWTSSEENRFQSLHAPAGEQDIRRVQEIQLGHGVGPDLDDLEGLRSPTVLNRGELGSW